MKVALLHLDDIELSDEVTDAIRVTEADTDEDNRETEEDESEPRRALDLLGSRRKVVAVALANKLARIVWAIITTGEAFCSSIYGMA